MTLHIWVSRFVWDPSAPSIWVSATLQNVGKHENSDMAPRAVRGESLTKLRYNPQISLAVKFTAWPRHMRVTRCNDAALLTLGCTYARLKYNSYISSRSETAVRRDNELSPAVIARCCRHCALFCGDRHYKWRALEIQVHVYRGTVLILKRNETF